MLRIRGSIGDWTVDLPPGDGRSKTEEVNAPAAKPLNQDDALWQIAKDLLRKAGQLSGPDLLEQLRGSATSGKRLLVCRPLQAALCFLSSSLESFPRSMLPTIDSGTDRSLNCLFAFMSGVGISFQVLGQGSRICSAYPLRGRVRVSQKPSQELGRGWTKSPEAFEPFFPLPLTTRLMPQTRKRFS